MKKTSRLLGEFELIARYFAPLARGFPGAFGLLDDAAVIAPPPGHELVAKTDAIVGGVHFLHDDPPDLIARKALRVNLSDLAAKGAVPRAYMLDIMLPATVTEQWIAAFARGLAQDQEAYGVPLIGGDTDSTPGPLAIAIMAFGDVATGQLIRRCGARAGDTVFVTGTIGDAALGLDVLRGALPNLDANAAGILIDRYRLPRPRVTLGPRLIGLASAALALSPGRVASVFGGGDDYEILFTAPRPATDGLNALSNTLGVPITAIGRMEPLPAGGGAEVTVLDGSGRPLAFERDGWTHF